VVGPFEGCWVAALSVPLMIYDLSPGGCLVQAEHEVRPGSRFSLELHLPHESPIQVEAEVLYPRANYGFAVKFVDVPPETQATLDRVVGRLLAGIPRGR
jgi:hypothetical protein